jgi:hypothetical protein
MGETPYLVHWMGDNRLFLPFFLNRGAISVIFLSKRVVF